MEEIFEVQEWIDHVPPHMWYQYLRKASWTIEWNKALQTLCIYNKHNFVHNFQWGKLKYPNEEK